ncbi:MAG: DUF4349 domain-containing protein [Dehalococcoidales bacterium]|nr:DUF4349 domain-containing protein [Dehalococcoidales bacterium]
MKRIIIGIALVMLLLIPVSCTKAPAPMPAPTPAPAPAPAPAPTIILPPSPAPEEVYKDSGAGALPSTAEERMIIRTGEMSLVVKDVIDARDEIAQLAVNFGGYVVSSRIWGEEEEMRGRISIRVPDDKFEPVLSELSNMAVRVESESTDSQDVTEEYTDLESRLKNAEATESQYLALLEKAEVEETIRIYELLHQVRREIEQIKGRMQYLERTSSMSLIQVRLEPKATAKPLVRAGWSVLEALKSAVRGIVIFGQWLGTTAIWLLIFSPVWGAILGIVLWWRHRRKKRKAAS